MVLNMMNGQQLLDGTAESVTVQERLDYLRKLENAQTPITFTDRQGRKHLVFDTKITLQRPLNRLDNKEEPRVSLVFLDAHDGEWLQKSLALSLAFSFSGALTNQTTFVWGPSASNTFNWNFGVWQ
jgi:hypothetical protein